MTDPARLGLVYYPDPCLNRRSAEVTRFDATLAALVDRMIALMHEHRGVGLAAPQVGVNLRVFVCQPPDTTSAQVYINPELTLGDEEAVADEGCLSLPDVSVQVQRAVGCDLKGVDLRGKPVHVGAEGMPARIWQHECDHLDGHLIIERMTESERIANRKLLKQLEQDFNKRGRPRKA